MAQISFANNHPPSQLLSLKIIKLINEPTNIEKKITLLSSTTDTNTASSKNIIPLSTNLCLENTSNQDNLISFIGIVVKD